MLACGAPEVSLDVLFARDEEVWGYADAAGKAKGGANDEDRAMHHSQWRLPAPSVDYCYPRTCLTPALACSLRLSRILTDCGKDCEKLLARRARCRLPATEMPAAVAPLASARAFGARAPRPSAVGRCASSIKHQASMRLEPASSACRRLPRQPSLAYGAGQQGRLPASIGCAQVFAQADAVGRLPPAACYGLSDLAPCMNWFVRKEPVVEFLDGLKDTKCRG